MPLTAGAGELRLAVRVTPGASKDEIEGVATDSAGEKWLRVRLCAPPVDGKANQALVKFLAKRWRVPKSAIAITSGAASRNKILTIQGDVETILETIAAAIEAEL